MLVGISGFRAMHQGFAYCSYRCSHQKGRARLDGSRECVILGVALSGKGRKDEFSFDISSYVEEFPGIVNRYPRLRVS